MSSDGEYHFWSRCHACGMAPIIGTRFECKTCPAGPDNDLCESCYSRFLQGGVTHPVDARANPATGHLHRFVKRPGCHREDSQRWLAVGASPAAEPAIPDRFVVRPEFQCVDRQSMLGSYAFAAWIDSPTVPLVLTALHVLDQVVRFFGVDCSPGNERYTGRELPNLISGVALYDVFAPRWMFADVGHAGPMLALPGARIPELEPYSQRDLAAFCLGPGVLTALQLAEDAPSVGTPIWLAASDGRTPAGRTCQAVVVEQSDRTFIFRYTRAVPVPPHSSGAPLVTADGKVVGINVGVGTLDNDVRVGHGIHARSIRAIVEQGTRSASSA